MKKRILSIVLALCLVLAFMPQMAFAEGAGNPYTLKEGTAGANGDEGPGSLIDGTTNTKWCVTDFESAYIIFSTASSVKVSGYSITTGNDNAGNPGRNPKNWTLYGCNDYTGSGTDTWEKIHSVTKDTILQDENNKTYNFAFDKEETAYQYYKLEITAIQSGDVMQMSEFALTSCDHNWITSASVAPTCTAAGYTTRTCDGCGGTDYVYLAPVDHVFTGEGGACIYCGYSSDDLQQGYVDENGISRKLNDNTTEITEGLTAWDNTNGGWYIVKSDVTLGNVTVSGDVQLILADGCTLTVNGNIQGGSLTIYGQNGGTGKLFVSSITINGGIVEVYSITSGNGGTGGSPDGSYGNGSNGGKGGEITINGGIVEADSITSGNGGEGGYGYSGGGKGGNGGSITITGGMVKVSNIKSGKGGNGGSADEPNQDVSGGSGGKGGNITINGGIVEADSITSGIGGTGGYGYTRGGNGGNGGNIIINGGIVEVGSITSGSGGSGGSWGSSSGGSNGNDGIVVSIVINTGIVFQGNSGQVYGARATLSENFAIPAGKTLTIDSGKTLIILQGKNLTVSEGATLTSSGTISNSGKIYVDGTFTGTADNLYYPLTIVNATAYGDTSEYNSKNYGKAGSTIALTPDTPTGYRFDGWTVSSGSAVTIDEGNSFTMPSAALTVTAKWIKCTHSGGLTHTPAVPATYTEYGVKEYWTCSTCNMNFSDAAGTNEIADLDAWKTGDGKIDKLTAPAPGKSDSVASDKEGNVSVIIEKSIVTVNGKTEVTVSESIANTILSKLASSSSKKVIINATTGKNTASKPVVTEHGTSMRVNLPGSAVKKLAEVENIEITLVTDHGKVVLDKDTIAAVASKAGNNGQVTLVIETVEQNNNLLKIELEIKTSNGDVTDFNKGNVKVTVAISEVLKGKKPVCVYIDEDGRYHKIGGILNADGTFTFVTGHFSTYAIMAEEEADTAIAAQQKAETLAALEDQKLAVRSELVTMKNGKKAVKITWHNEDGKMMDFDGVEIYRSTKRNSGYGKTPIFTTEKDAYYNTAIKPGTRYYYRARGFVIIDGQKYYTDWSLKAIRTVK